MAKQVWKDIPIISNNEMKRDWRKSSSDQYNENCKSVLYYCAYGKKRSCPVQIKMKVYLNGDVEFKQNSHEHKNHRNDYVGLTPEQREFTADVIDKNYHAKPNEILRLFRKFGKQEPPKDKLVTFLKALRETVTPRLDLGGIRDWCEKKSKVPESDDEVFVPGFLIEGTTEENFTFWVTLTTKRLLNVVSKFNILCADATYQLNWHGYPIMVTGCVDKEKKFHPAMMMISKRETSRDFQFLFKTLKKAMEDFSTLPFTPTYLMADSAEAITSAFIEVFGSDFKRIHCFFHCKFAYEKKLSLIRSNDDREKISGEIDDLQLCSSPTLFARATELWLKKYKTASEDIKAFVFEYFEKTWLLKNCGWYEGFAVGYPSTNNALESFNKRIKVEVTHKLLKGIGEFLQEAAKGMEHWSIERNRASVNHTTIALEPAIRKKKMKEFYEWFKNNPAFTLVPEDGVGLHGFYKKKSSRKMYGKVFKKYLRVDYATKIKTFAAYKQFKDFVRIVTIPDKVLSVNDASCTCFYFLKHYMCMHVMAFCAQEGIYNFPIDCRPELLSRKTKRGRKRKAKGCLQKQ